MIEYLTGLDVSTANLSDDVLDKALSILLTVMQQGLLEFKETYLPDVMYWNCISNFCINSHIALVIALRMAIRETDIFHWKDSTHTEVLFALSKGGGGGDNRTMAVSRIFRDSDGDLKSVDNLEKSHVRVPIRVNDIQFTGGSDAWGYGLKLETVVDQIWPETNGGINKVTIQELIAWLASCWRCDIGTVMSMKATVLWESFGLSEPGRSICCNR